MPTKEAVGFVHADASAGVSLTRLARSAGLEAKTYDSVDDLLTDEKRGELGCVVLDTSLRGEQAFEILKLLHETEGPMTPVILLSITHDPQLRKRARELGAAGFLREPVDGEALLDVIRWALCKPTDSK